MQKSIVRWTMILVFSFVMIVGIGIESYAAEKPLFLDVKTGTSYTDVSDILEKISANMLDIEDVYKRFKNTGLYVSVSKEYDYKKKTLVKFLKDKGVDLSSPKVSLVIQETIEDNQQEFSEMMANAEQDFADQHGQSYDSIMEDAEPNDTTDDIDDGTTDNPDNVTPDGMIPLADPEKIVTFMEPEFEYAVRVLYDLPDGPIRWKDIGYRTKFILDEEKESENQGPYVVRHCQMGFLTTLEDFKWLPNLKEISAVENQNFCGDLMSLTRLKRLEKLTLKGCVGMMGDLSSISNLKNLQHLDLSIMTIDGDLSDLSELKKLKTIKFHDTDVTGDLSSISGCKQLENIDFSVAWKGDPIPVMGDLSSLSGMKHLKRLCLYRAKGISGDLSSLSDCKDLEYLSIEETPIGGDIGSLGGMTKLTGIFARETNISGDIGGIRGCKSLEWLYISKTSVGGSINSLSGLDSIISGNINHTSIEGKLKLSGGNTLYDWYNRENRRR